MREDGEAEAAMLPDDVQGGDANHRPDVAFLITNYNMAPLVEKCLDDLQQQMQDSGLDYEVIVGDNSVDPAFSLSPERCAAFPRTRHVECRHLRGWIPALNELIRLTRARHICILHPDVAFGSDCVRRCVTYLDTRADCGVAAPNPLRPDGSPSVVRLQGPTARSEFKRLLNFLLRIPLRRRLLKERDLWNHAEDTEAESVLSFCYFVRGDLARSLVPFGGDQETYFGNDDLCYSARRRGFKVTYLAEPRITHFERRTPQALYASDMNYKTSAVLGSPGMRADELRFVRRHCPRATYLAIRAFMAVEFALSTAMAWLKHRGRANDACRTYVDLLRMALVGPPNARRS